jgi:hypothetical protein
MNLLVNTDTKFHHQTNIMSVFFGVVATCGLTLVGSRYAYPELYELKWLKKRYMSILKSRKRTILDIQNADDAVALVQRIARGNAGGDELADRLFRLYKHFPPDEKEMRVLCTLYEVSRGKGTTKECACTLLYGVTTDVLCNNMHNTNHTETTQPLKSSSFEMVREPRAVSKRRSHSF